jgi:hypothetical protein
MSERPLHASAVEESEPDTLQIVLIGAIGTVLFVIAVFVLTGLYEHVQRREVHRKVVAVTPQELQILRIKQMETLAATVWVDPEAGAVTIPIERAMALIVRDPGLRAVALPVAPAAAGATP